MAQYGRLPRCALLDFDHDTKCCYAYTLIYEIHVKFLLMNGYNRKKSVMILHKLDIVEMALMAFDHVGPTYIQRA